MSIIATLSRLQMRMGKAVNRLFYVSSLWKIVDRSYGSILDIGCGRGSSIVRHMRTKVNDQYIVGCDIFPNYVKSSSKSKLYDECVVADARHLPFIHRSFELVFCLEVIEHLEKPEGEELLSSLEELSSKEVVLSTPVGFMYQSQHDNNPYHTHKSGWFPNDFKKRGYRVIGVIGPFFIRRRGNNSKLDKYIASLAGIGSFLLQPLFYLFPDLAFQMIGAKELI